MPNNLEQMLVDMRSRNGMGYHFVKGTIVAYLKHSNEAQIIREIQAIRDIRVFSHLLNIKLLPSARLAAVRRWKELAK